MSEVDTGALGPGRIEPRELEQEMRSSFLDYAMSVIVSRALPDVRDGLKPVHRRVLYGMHEDGLQPGRPYKKSAATVDATCPLVTKVHAEAKRYAADGYTVVLVGHAGHEEVEGTMGEAPDSIVLVESVADAE